MTSLSDLEDWLKRTWDFSFDTLDGLFWFLGVGTSRAERVEGLRHFMGLVVWRAAPESLKAAVAEYLQDGDHDDTDGG